VSALTVVAQDAPCGAVVTGLDLTQALTEPEVTAIRDAWLQHQVLVFPNQPLQLEDIERFAATVGPFGTDTYFEAVPGHPHVAQVRRDANETTGLFAESWHSDWSFLAVPPQATVLFGNLIPPVGGDTLFANQYLAWETLPAALKARVEGRQGHHSARNGYSRQGIYGEKDVGRSMAIKYSDTALDVELHPIGRVHPETGRTALFVSPGYTIGIDGLDDDESREVLGLLFEHQAQTALIYQHRWSQDMLVMWDNRCVTHAATGGYEGHARLLHRITVAESALA
jgi:taurine dioxygenase